jgi:Tol biopolymer transport system component
MSDEQSSSSYAPFIALAVVLVLFVLALIGVLVAALIIFVLTSSTPAASSIEDTAPLNRLAVIADDRIYTIDPDGSDRLDLAHDGSVPTAAVIWSRDGRHLFFVASDRSRTRLLSARPDGQETRVLYEAARIREPFYLYGSPDDQHVAFLASDPQEGMQLHIARTDRPDSTRSAVAGQPNYSSWSPDSQSLLVHIGGTRAQAYVGTYDLNAAQTQKIETRPAAFQAPYWSPDSKARWLYARQSGSRAELVIGDENRSRTLTEFDGGIAFSSSPDGQRVAYALNTSDSFIYKGLTVIALADSSSHVIFNGNVLAFFWSPDGKKLAYLTGALVEPLPTGRAGGLAAPRMQQRTLQVTWHVIDLASGRTIDLNTFEPTDSFLYLIQYFDQFAQSAALWSPDSRSLVYAGQPLIGERGVYVIDAQAAAAPRFVGPGDYAIWSWH